MQKVKVNSYFGCGIALWHLHLLQCLIFYFCASHLKCSSYESLMNKLTNDLCAKGLNLFGAWFFNNISFHDFSVLLQPLFLNNLSHIFQVLLPNRPYQELNINISISPHLFKIIF